MSLTSGPATPEIVPHVMREGAFVFVARVHGLDENNPAAGLEQQVTRALGRISQALDGCGASLRDVVQARFLMPHGAAPEAFARCAGRLRDALGDVRPVATMVATGVLRPGVGIEIEVRARLAG